MEWQRERLQTEKRAAAWPGALSVFSKTERRNIQPRRLRRSSRWGEWKLNNEITWNPRAENAFGRKETAEKPSLMRTVLWRLDPARWRPAVTSGVWRIGWWLLNADWTRFTRGGKIPRKTRRGESRGRMSKCINLLGLITKCHTLGGLNTKHLFPHSSWDLQVQDQGIGRQGWFFPEVSHPDLQVVAFPLCCVLIFSSGEDTSHIGRRPTQTASV